MAKHQHHPHGDFVGGERGSSNTFGRFFCKDSMLGSLRFQARWRLHNAIIRGAGLVTSGSMCAETGPVLWSRRTGA